MYRIRHTVDFIPVACEAGSGSVPVRAAVAVIHVFMALVSFNEGVNEAIISLAAGSSFTKIH